MFSGACADRRFGHARVGQQPVMPLLHRLLWPRSLLNPVSRLALATFAWNHRHEILRWGRSLYDQLIGRTDVSPARALRIGTVLYAIASDSELRNARQLRKVTMDGDDVDLTVDASWKELPRLVERVARVKGVRHITVNGHPSRPALRRRATS
jgi:hypothetical protein